MTAIGAIHGEIMDYSLVFTGTRINWEFGITGTTNHTFGIRTTGYGQKNRDFQEL